MDEPSEGLAPAIRRRAARDLHGLVAEGIGLLVVEQNLGVAARSADRLLAMASARIEEEMQAAALLADDDAQRRYLGVEALAGSRAVTAKSAAA